MALVCQGVVSQLRNHLRNGVMAAKIGVLKLCGFRRAFRSQGLISQRASWGCKNIFQPRVIFVEGPFGLRNLAHHGFSLLLNSFLAP